MSAGKAFSVALSVEQIEFLNSHVEILGITIPSAIKRIINNAMMESSQKKGNSCNENKNKSENIGD